MLNIGQLQAQNDLQDRYDWLVAFADPNDCTTEKVEEYESFVGYKYLLITFADGSQQLHNAEGTFYCKNAENYDCVSAYRLNGPTATWTCSNPQTAEDDLIRRLQNSATNCYSIVSISRYEYEGNSYYLPNAGPVLNSCGVLESFPSLYDVAGRRICDFGFTALPCPIALTQETLVWTAEDATCEVIDPFSLPIIQNIINDPIIISNSDGEVCVYYEQIIQFQYEGATYYRINENFNQAPRCAIEFGDRFYTCEGELIGGTGIYPACDDAAVCIYDIPTLNAAANASGIIIWESEYAQDNNEQDKIFEDFPWLIDLVDPNNCGASTIEIYGGNAQHPYNYLLVTDTNGDAKLYNTNGALYCTQTSTNDCISVYVNTYGISSIPFRTWTCEQNNNCVLILCPPIFQPVCGVDGNTYSNSCEANCAGVDIAFDGPCNIDPSDECLVTISNTQCRRIDVYDTNDRLLTTMDSGPFGNAPLGTPTPTWTDPTPLLGNEVRTYIFKEGNFILTRTTATCDNKEITTSNPYAAGCNDGLSLGIYTNTGCRTMTMVNTRSQVISTLEPGESATLTATNFIYIFLVGNDTIDIKSDVGGDIDSGGCGNGNPCTITITNNECRIIGVYDENDTPLTTMNAGPHPFGPLNQPASVWVDARPLDVGATRTYIFKENNLILGRQTVTCNNTNITVASNYFSGCTDALGLSELRNIGCRDIQVLNTSGNVIQTAAPGEDFGLTTGINLYILMAGTDTLAIGTGFGDGGIDSGGCGNNNAIFNDYPWLTDLVDPNNCSVEEVATYQSGIYTYLLVTNAIGEATLYNQDGQFYCENSSNYDCVAAYNLGAAIDTWTCTDTSSGDCLTDEQLVEQITSLYEEFCYEVIHITQIDYNGQRFFKAYTGITPFSPVNCLLSDSFAPIYDCEGKEVCTQPLICDDLFLQEERSFWTNPDFLGCGCTDLIMPVCGVDGITYRNPCYADCAGVAVAFESDCNDAPTDGCSVTITNNECRVLRIYDENDVLLTIKDERPSSIRPNEVWQDTRPLAGGESRTYVFKDELLELGRQTVTCDNPNITLVNRFDDGCTENIEPTALTNVGCSLLRVFNVRGGLMGRAFPGETLFLENLGEYHILMVNKDTIGVEFNLGVRDIDTGGCPDRTNYNNVQIFEEYSWLTDLIDLNNCSTESVEVWQARTTTYVWVVDENGNGKLYSENGQIQCQPSPTFPINCFQAYELRELVAVWICGSMDNSSFECNTVGLLDFISCAPDLKEVAVYHYQGNNYVVYFPKGNNAPEIYAHGCDSFNRICEGAGCNDIITAGTLLQVIYTTESCPEDNGNNSDEIFKDYPWISVLVNPTNCSNEKIAVYQSGVYNYLLVTNAAGVTTLYNQDGQFYCQNSSNYDCIAAYNLGAPINTWECTGGNGGCAYAEIIRLNPCDPKIIETALYEFDGNNYIVAFPDDYSSAVPLPTTIRNCTDGSIYCNQLFTGCEEFFERATKLEVLASRADCSTCSILSVTGVAGEIVITDQRISLPVVPIEILVTYVNKATRVQVARSFSFFSSLSIPVEFENGNNEFEVYITHEDGLTCSYDVTVIETVVNPPSTACNLFSNIPNGTDLCEACYKDISVYEFRGEDYIVYRAQNPDCRELELQVVNCATNIGFCVAGRNIGLDRNCPIFWSEAIFVENLWTDAGCATSPEEDCAEGSFAYEGTVIENECGVYILTTDNQYLTTNYPLHGIGTSILVGTTISFNFINTATGDDFCINREYGGVNRFGEISCLKVINEPSNTEGDCAEGSIAYEGTVIENECGTYVLTTDNQYITIGTSIPVGTTISFNFIYVTHEDGSCPNGQPNALFGTITCIEIISEPSNCQNTGTIFFENCDDGRLFYFIRTDEGQVYDPYFDDGIDFTPIDEQRVNFDFVDATFSAPCSIAEKAIIITCVEEIAESNLEGSIPENFEDYDVIYRMCKGDTLELPWLTRTLYHDCPVYCPPPGVCGPPGPEVQFEKWSGSNLSFDRVNDKVLLYPTETTSYTANYPSFTCPPIRDPNGPAGPQGAPIVESTDILTYLVIVEEDANCIPSAQPEETIFNITACPGDTIRTPTPARGLCPFGPFPDPSASVIRLIRTYGQNVHELVVQGSGVVRLESYVGDWTEGSVTIECSPRTYIYNITCPDTGTTEDAIFSEFSWLSDIVNPTACNGETISVYQLGSFKYVYISSATGSELYFQDGTFYCIDAPNYNCRNVYGLSKIIATWNCANLLPESKERRSDQSLETSFFTIAPNPTTDQFTIQLPEVSDKEFQVQVIDMLGRIVHQKKLAARTRATTIDLADYQNGIYYVELRATGIRSVKKLVKQGLE